MTGLLRARFDTNGETVQTLQPSSISWTVAAVRGRFREAALTLQRLPDRDRRVLYGGGSGWPDVVRQAAEAYAYGEVGVRVQPSAGAIDRMHEVFGWCGWLSPVQLRIAWAAASGISVAKLARRIGCHRDTVRRRRDEAHAVVARRLVEARATIALADE